MWELIMQGVKQTWIFAIVWKLLMMLLPQKKYFAYGRNLMGFILLFFWLNFVKINLFNEIESEYFEKIVNKGTFFEEIKELYTENLKIKTEFNIQENWMENSQKSEEISGNSNRGYGEKNERKQIGSVNKMQISTLNVEKIQLIKRRNAK